ncbi:hypothetical protein ACFLRB_02585 [Acidobacteriota bacterium]
MEKMGTGIRKMQRLMQEAGLPPINFEFGNFFNAILKRPSGESSGGVNGGVMPKHRDRWDSILSLIKKEDKLKINLIVAALRIPTRTLERAISHAVP